MFYEKLSSWALLLFLMGVGFAQYTYYIHNMEHLRDVSFVFMVSGIVVMLLAMIEDLKSENKSYLLSLLGIVLVMALYVVLRQEVHRFDFGVGDASDYYVAGLCSVTYGQDIGFFMPLAASLTGVGYDVLGIEYVPWINVIVYALSMPVSYFIFRALSLNTWVSMIMTILVVLAPSSIWFSKTSFSEVPWQLFLLLFIFLAYKVLQKERLSYISILTLYLLLFLAPFIRGEGALYYGLVVFLGFYHFWKYSNIKSLLWIIIGLFILSIGIQITVAYKEAYLLGWQFSRVIPDITVAQLLTLLYGFSIASVIFSAIAYYFRKGFSKLNIPFIITVLAILIKLAIAYIYAKKKEVSFGDMFFFNEFGLAVGNFGMWLSILIVIGIVLMYYRAIKGEVLPFILVIMYTIFYLPFVMQAVTFEDVHAFFFYWNRYYFSIFMMVHLFALGLTFQFIYLALKRSIQSNTIKNLIVSGLILIISILSLDAKLLNIMITESHHKGSYKLYPWLKEKVTSHAFSVVYDDSIRYKQNKAHLGTYHLKTLINRQFSTLKIYAKEWEAVKPSVLKSGYTPKYMQHDYVLCLSGDECHLNSEYLVVEDNLTLPIEWREHYSLAEEKKEHKKPVTESKVNHFDLHAVLYKKSKKFKLDKEVHFTNSVGSFSHLLTDGWEFINNGTRAFSSKGMGTIRIPNIKYDINKAYVLKITYAVINAMSDSPKVLTFKINGNIIKEVEVDSYKTREVEVPLPQDIWNYKPEDRKILLQSSNKGQIMLRALALKVQKE